MARKVEFVEVVRDEDLQKRQGEATKAFRRYFPEAPPVQLYRTADGRVGVQTRFAIAVGEHGKFQKAFAAVMKILGEKRGRPASEPKVQVKMRISEPVFMALKAKAVSSRTSLSALIENLARKSHLV